MDYVLLVPGCCRWCCGDEHVEAGTGVDEAGVQDAAADVVSHYIAAWIALRVAANLADQSGLGPVEGSIAGLVKGFIGDEVVHAGYGRLFSPGDGVGAVGIGLDQQHADGFVAAGVADGLDGDALGGTGHFDFETDGGVLDGLPLELRAGRGLDDPFRGVAGQPLAQKSKIAMVAPRIDRPDEDQDGDHRQIHPFHILEIAVW